MLPAAYKKGSTRVEWTMCECD